MLSDCKKVCGNHQCVTIKLAKVIEFNALCKLCILPDQTFIFESYNKMMKNENTNYFFPNHSWCFSSLSPHDIPKLKKTDKWFKY